MEGIVKRLPQSVPLHTLRGKFYERVSNKAGDNRAELTASDCRAREALLAELMDAKRDDAFLRWPVEE